MLEKFNSKPGFKHILDKNMRPLIEHITREWTTDFWIAFLSKTGEWNLTDKGHMFHKLIQMFKVRPVYIVCSDSFL